MLCISRRAPTNCCLNYQQRKDKKKGSEKDETNSITEKEHVIKLAAELIRNDLKALDSNKSVYFSYGDLTS